MAETSPRSRAGSRRPSPPSTHGAKHPWVVLADSRRSRCQLKQTVLSSQLFLNHDVSFPPNSCTRPASAPGLSTRGGKTPTHLTAVTDSLSPDSEICQPHGCPAFDQTPKYRNYAELIVASTITKHRLMCSSQSPHSQPFDVSSISKPSSVGAAQAEPRNPKPLHPATPKP